MPKPVPALPNGITTEDFKTFIGTVLDTTYAAPTGNVIPAHNVQELKDALKDCQPGDVIELEPGVEYAGNFVVPAKQQTSPPQWIHLTTAGFHENHSEGTRVIPDDAIDMARLVSPNASQVLSFESGQPAASHIRIYGVELTSKSNYAPSGYTPGVYYGYALVSIAGAWQDWDYQHVPDHIIFDRVYVHGDDTHDLQCGLQANFGPVAVIDSYVSEIHMKGTDTAAVGNFCTPGPIKLVNNHLEAAGENVIFGGSGGNVNQNPADIEIQDNYFFKPLEWVDKSLQALYVVKNSFEIKDGRRVLFNHNVIENCWAAAQMGYAIVLTVRSSQSGDNARCDDVTITNNILRNVTAGVNTLGADDVCGNDYYVNCHNAGGQARWLIENNLVIFYDPTIAGGNRNSMINIQPGLDRHANQIGQIHDIVVRHNTCVAPTAQCWAGIYFGTGNKTPDWNNPAAPFTPPLSDNLWFLDNVMQKQTYGDHGQYGLKGLNIYMLEPHTPPDDVNARFRGNVMWRQTDKAYDWPPDNTVEDVIQFVNEANGDYTLTQPAWTQTSDGKLAGVNMDYLPGGEAPAPPELTGSHIGFQLDLVVGVGDEPTVDVRVVPESIHWLTKKKGR